jgi:broad specificity phosphatase PhoE
MLTIKLVRHGESEANTGHVLTHEVGDHEVALSTRGHEQARDMGRALGRQFLTGARVYSSPYKRTRQTVASLLIGASDDGGLDLGADLRVFEDPRLREVEHGYDPVPPQEDLRRRHGWFYYRFRGGESPADCFDRTSSFLESMMRGAERHPTERILIVTHGLLIRCFVMRFLHLSVEAFDAIQNPSNCAIITLADKSTLSSPVFTSGSWGVTGLTLRDESGGA